MNLFDYSKEAYYYELNRRSELTRALSLPIGLGVIIGGAIFSVVKTFPWALANEFIFFSFIFFSVTTAVLLAISIYFMARAYISYEYAYLPTAREIINYYYELETYYASKNLPKRKANADVKNYLIQEQSSNAHHNSLNNNRKSAHLYKGNLCLAFAVSLLAMASLLSLIPNVENSYEQGQRQRETRSAKTAEAPTATKPTHQRERG